MSAVASASDSGKGKTGVVSLRVEGLGVEELSGLGLRSLELWGFPVIPFTYRSVGYTYRRTTSSILTSI